MSALFPAPVRSYTTFSDSIPSSTSTPSSPQRNPIAHIPQYPLRIKQQFVPRRHEDFGDGGAYPELHIAQFPLGMGKKGENGSFSQNHIGTLALQVRGEDGKVSYDAIVTQQHRDKTKVYTKFSDIVEKDDDGAALMLPSKDEEIETANRTRDALQSLVQGKVASSLPTNVGRQKSAKETATYFRYTPNDQGTSGVPKQRIIRMVEVAKDPMEPPKFRHTKAVRGPPSPPVPVLHSPPRKLTVADQQSWKIPPCISNWKNSKGFTIALDKRLAADGRGLQQVTVNDNFASLSEALAIAERKAREEVNMRAQVQKKLAMKQKEQKENELRELASKARMERAGIRANCEEDEDNRSRKLYSSDHENDESDEEGRRERDAVRRERKKEREREMRMEKMGKKGKMGRDQDRDISEKIALGQLQGGGRIAGSDGLFDSRLFNQSQGMNSGFGHEDEYNVYSKPMVDRGKASVYRPKGDDGAMDADKEYEELKGGHQKRFKADKQFRGTEDVAQRGGRDGPVQFSFDELTKEEDVTNARPSTAPSERRSRSNSSKQKMRSTRERKHPLPESSPRSRSRSTSPKRRANSPRSRSGSSKCRSNSPSRHSDSPRRRFNSPKRRFNSPRRSPRRSSNSGSRRSGSPRRRLNSPRRRSNSRRRFNSPRRRSNSPRRRSNSPGRRSGSPRRRFNSPRRRSNSPRRRSGSPRRRSGSPRRRFSSPRRRSESPRQRSISSSRSRSRSNLPTRRSRISSPFRGRKRSVSRGRKRSPSRSLSYARERGRPRARSRSPSYSRNRRKRHRSPSSSRSFSRSSRSSSRSRSRSRNNRHRRSSSEDSDDDPFGLDQFLTDARNGSGQKRRSSGRDRRRD